MARHRLRIGPKVVAGLVLLGIVPGRPSSRAQEAPAAPAGGGGQAAKDVTDLTARYRLHEVYAVGDKRPAEAAIGQYRVGLRETFKTAVERPQGAPIRTEIGVHAIYQERPAQLSSLDERRVTDVVRQYEMVRATPDRTPKGSKAPKPFEGLSIWLRTVPRELPEIMVLTPNHALTDLEYRVASRQVFVPDLSFVLPELAVRVGEPWTLSIDGAQALLGTEIERGTLRGRITQIQADPAGVERTAIIDVTGQVTIIFDPLSGREVPTGEAAVHAEVRFTYTPTDQAKDKAAPPGDQPKEDHGVVLDVPGRIVRVSLAEEISTDAMQEGDRRQKNIRREMVLERQSAALDAAPLDVPRTAPKLTPDNSWLTYVDPQERYHIRHPQDLRPLPTNSPDVVRLVHPRAQGADSLELRVAPKAGLDADKMRKALIGIWEEKQYEVVPGLNEWLPEADWPGMKVYRMEAALMPQGGGRSAKGIDRVHFYGYVLLTGRDLGLEVRASTDQDPPTKFRDDVETSLKTFRFGPPEVNESNQILNQIAPGTKVNDM